jgi:hypothetical protein
LNGWSFEWANIISHPPASHLVLASYKQTKNRPEIARPTLLHLNFYQFPKTILNTWKWTRTEFLPTPSNESGPIPVEDPPRSQYAFTLAITSSVASGLLAFDLGWFLYLVSDSHSSHLQFAISITISLVGVITRSHKCIAPFPYPATYLPLPSNPPNPYNMGIHFFSAAARTCVHATGAAMMCEKGFDRTKLRRGGVQYGNLPSLFDRVEGVLIPRLRYSLSFVVGLSARVFGSATQLLAARVYFNHFPATVFH